MVETNKFGDGDCGMMNFFRNHRFSADILSRSREQGIQG